MLIRYILYTGIVLISICNGELLLLSKPDNDKTVYSCLASGDDENSTLFWWSNNKPLNLLPSNPFEEEEIKIPSNNWSNGLSFSFNVEPLTDERWEDLPIIKIGRNKSHEISHSSIMRLSLSFYAEDEVQLLFNNNNRIIFRNQELPTENIFLIQYGKWNHISLTKTQFYLNSNQKNVSFNIDLSYVTIRPINEDSYWKIHNYTFIFSKRAEKATPVAHIHHNGEPLCLSFFITMCYNCSLTFKVNNENRLIQNRNRDNQWQKHNIYIPKTRSSILVLYTSSNNSQGEYWIIHKFTKCRKGLRSSIVITKESNVTCTNSEEPKELISRNTCFEEDYYSNFCKLKLKSEYKDPCKQSKICIENKGCVCSWGFKGKKCTEECERGKWGINCNNTCGNCAKPETCDKFTGKCDECAGNYFGNYCYGLPKIHLSDISFTSSVINLQNGIYQARQLHYKLISENTWTTIQIYNKSYINIINLQAGQTYQLKLFYNISSTCEYELDFAETNFTTKFEVERLENFTISTTSHSAKFSWTPKDKCESLKNGYKIKYRLLHKIFCNVSNRTPEFSTVANETNFEINDLQSFSTYHILIYITTDGGKTLGDIIHNGTFNTTDGDISSEELPTAITATNTSIVIKQAKCESLNGNITYELIFKTSNITLDVQQNTPVPYEKELNVTIQGLLPFSKYSVILKIVRNNSTREYKQSQIVFTSLPGEPPMVREAVVYSKNISHIWLRWKPPNPPNGELEHYNITILQLKNTTVKNTFQRKRHPCKFWTGYECYIIESFNNSASYAIKIEAKNKNVDKFGEAVFVNITSKQGKCHSPTNISTEIKNNNILTVKWLCAPITNGTFQRFYINFSPVHNDNVKEKIVDATDPAKHKCEVSEQLNFSSTYKISINGVNECIGFSYYILVDTFPPEPSFNASVEESCSNISCIVRIQSLKNISETSTLYVTTSSSQRNNCDIYDINKFIEENKNESCKTSLNQTTTDLNIDFQNCADRICGSHINTINCSDQFLTVIVVNYYYHRFNNSTICLNITYNNGNINQNKLSIIIAGATIGAVFFLIVLVIIIYIIFFRNKGKDDIFNVAFSKRNGCQIGRPEEVALCSKNNEIYESTSNLLSMSVQIDEYENYLRNYFGNNKEELRKQFEVIPKMELHSSSVGTLESNKNKNRYKNIKAYEHSRVKLKGLPSDYIHANFIDGYAFPKTYIATQGPKSNTVIDFWHMIMQNNVQYIVMLCNVMENNKKKCMQYWPAENETVVFSEFVVKNIKSNVYTNYVNRKLEITYKDEKRIVQHLHFTKWTDHGTPTYVQTVVPFMKKMTDIPSISYPIVVHCSAGAGRTGTIILSDIVLKMAHNSGSIDFVSSLVKLREQRYGLVDNLDQYIFAHLLVYEYLFGQNFSIPVDISCKSLVNFAVENDVMENILKYVNNMSWQNLTTNNLQITDEMKIKNRFQNIVPGNNILFLSPYPYDDQSSIYINAVSVDCFYSDDKFIVTQQPLPETVGDFWRLAYQYDVNVIINLNEIEENHKNSCIFWPDMNEIITPSDVIVSCHAEEDCNLYWSKEITISHIRSKNIKNTIKFFSVKNWKSTDLVCDNLQTLLLLHQHAFSSVTNKIVVTCYDGATASGLFVSLAFVIEKFKLEHNIDVCLAIQTVRKSRNEFVRSKEQVKFLYDSALEYFKTFETYSNFNGLME